MAGWLAGWLAGWGGGGLRNIENKANLSPAGAGASLSLAIFLQTLFLLIFPGSKIYMFQVIKSKIPKEKLRERFKKRKGKLCVDDERGDMFLRWNM